MASVKSSRLFRNWQNSLKSPNVIPCQHSTPAGHLVQHQHFILLLLLLLPLPPPSPPLQLLPPLLLPLVLSSRPHFHRPLQVRPHVIGNRHGLIATYDFLLTLHSNQGPISYRFWDKRRFQLKIVNFPPRCVFTVPAVDTVNLGISAGSQTTRVMGLPGRERSLTISSAVWIQYTDRHWATAKKKI